MKAVRVLVCAVVCWVFCPGCSTLEVMGLRKPTVSLAGLRFQNVSLDSATLLFDVDVENPYSVPLPLVNVDYDLTTSSKPLFSGKADVQSTIPANSKKTVSLPAKIKYLDLVRAFKDIKPGLAIPYEAKLGLSVDTPALGKLRLPISKEGQLSVPSIPNISTIDWQKLILDKAGKQ